MMRYARVCDLCGARVETDTPGDNLPEGWTYFEYGPERKRREICTSCRQYLDLAPEGVVLCEAVLHRKLATAAERAPKPASGRICEGCPECMVLFSTYPARGVPDPNSETCRACEHREEREAAAKAVLGEGRA